MPNLLLINFRSRYVCTISLPSESCESCEICVRTSRRREAHEHLGRPGERARRRPLAMEMADLRGRKHDRSGDCFQRAAGHSVPRHSFSSIDFHLAPLPTFTLGQSALAGHLNITRAGGRKARPGRPASPPAGQLSQRALKPLNQFILMDRLNLSRDLAGARPFSRRPNQFACPAGRPALRLEAGAPRG